MTCPHCRKPINVGRPVKINMKAVQKLRNAGYTIREIAELVSMSPSAVHAALKRAN